MLTTRTGSYAIGFRRGWSPWQSDLASLIKWSKANDLDVIDLGTPTAAEVEQATAAGLRVGSVDLLAWPELIAPDSEVRAAAVAKNVDYIKSMAAVGVTNFFAVLLPQNPELPRSENLGYATSSLNALVPTLEKAGARIVIEGWPGPGALACTPESYRAVFNACPSLSIGVNYDPSHLIRMGIDHIRFLDEFADRVGHVHGKDTEMLSDRLYEFGTELPATLAKAHGFGAYAWRYTIPGHGIASWPRILHILEARGYKGAVCIELEDENFNTGEDGEKRGLLLGAQYLAGC
jgi:sugar phosphate isomerase/epimerase